MWSPYFFISPGFCMLAQLINRISEKHRFLFFLIVTSSIGVGLILIAVYNASRELEVIYEIENLHRFAKEQLDNYRPDTTDRHRLLALATDDYQVLIMRGNQVVEDSRDASDAGWDLALTSLNESRVNEYGGYAELDNQIFTWTQLLMDDNESHLFMLHRFTSTGFSTLKQVYMKRILVPAFFYIWLMVWMALIIRFLTDKLLQQKQELEHMALHDPLTSLPNRNLLAEQLNERLNSAGRKNGRFSFVMIDLDGFKGVNDEFGHAVGDILLQEVARRLGDCLRIGDIVARVGGDEFVLVLDDMQKGSSLDICNRVTDEIARPVTIEGALVNVGCSIGIANYPEHGLDAESLNHNADEAMYSAKVRGGGILIYGSEN